MRWRLAPSLANRACIPAPFCPTPLQYTTQDHSLVIDFVNWPSIRDQLILHRGEYDLDALIEDIVKGTVIDMPSVGSSFNVRDLFMTHIEGHATGTYGSDNPNNSEGQAGRSIMRLPSCRAELLSHVIDAMRDQNARKAAQNRGPWESHEPGSTRAVLPRTHAMSQFYGLDDLLGWKLSSKFAAKYQFLDCSGGQSTLTPYAGGHARLFASSFDR